MIYEYWLASLYKIDCNRRRQAVAAAGSAEALYRMPEKELRGLHLFSETEEALFLESRREADPEGAYEKFQRSGTGFLPITDPRYPEKLRQIYDPPFALYVKGRIPDGRRGAWRWWEQGNARNMGAALPGSWEKSWRPIRCR